MCKPNKKYKDIMYYDENKNVFYMNSEQMESEMIQGKYMGNVFEEMSCDYTDCTFLIDDKVFEEANLIPIMIA